MKHQTINLVKFKALSKRLQLPMCYTVGVLESLWLFSLFNARDGDLSKFSRLELAAWMDFPGDEDHLIDALVETGWLDQEGDNLTVHDWDDHKPNWLKGVVSRGEPSTEPGPQPSTEPGPQPSTEPGPQPSTEPRARVARTKPNLTQPNPTQDLTTHTPPKRVRSQKPTDQRQLDADFDAWWEAYPVKAGKAEARKAFTKAHAQIHARDGPANSMAWLLAITKRFADSPAGKVAGRYCPHPATWLNKGRYDDDPESWNRKDPENGTIGHRTAGYEFDPAKPTRHEL